MTTQVMFPMIPNLVMGRGESSSPASRASTEHRVVVLPLGNTSWMRGKVIKLHPFTFANGPSQIRNLCDGHEDSRQAAAQQAASNHRPRCRGCGALTLSTKKEIQMLTYVVQCLLPTERLLLRGLLA